MSKGRRRNRRGKRGGRSSRDLDEDDFEDEDYEEAPRRSNRKRRPSYDDDDEDYEERRSGRRRRKEDDDEDDDDYEDDDRRVRSGKKKDGSSIIKDNMQFIVAAVVIVLLIGAVIVISVLAPDDPGGTTEDPKNTWTDLKAFETYLSNQGHNYNVITDTNKITSKADGHESESLLIIVGVEEEFKGKETLSIMNFADEGGKVIIADDGTNTNIFSRLYGVEFDGAQVLMDGSKATFYYNYSFLPALAEIDGAPYDILLNAPTGLVTPDDWQGQVLAWAEEDIHIVLDDGDFLMEGPPEDVFAPNIPFALEVASGKGSVVFISDTGLFVDDFFTFGEYENEQFTTKLISHLLPDSGYIYFDHSKQTSTSSGHYRLPG